MAEVDGRLLDDFAVGEHPRPGDASPFVAKLARVEGAAVGLDQGVADAVLERAEVGRDRLRRCASDAHGAGISASDSPTAAAKPASVSSS